MMTRFSAVATLLAAFILLTLAGCVTAPTRAAPPEPMSKEVLEHAESAPILSIIREPRAGDPVITVQVRNRESRFFAIEDAAGNRRPSRSETHEINAAGVAIQANMHFSGAVRRIETVTDANGLLTLDLAPFVRAAYEDVRNDRLRVVFVLPADGKELVYDIPQDPLGHMYRAL